MGDGKQQNQPKTAPPAPPPTTTPPPSAKLIPSKDEFVAAGYKAETYDDFVKDRKAELKALILDLGLVEAAPVAPASVPRGPRGNPSQMTPEMQAAIKLEEAKRLKGYSMDQLLAMTGAENGTELLRWVAAQLVNPNDLPVTPEYKRIQVTVIPSAEGGMRPVPIPKKLMETKHRRTTNVTDPSTGESTLVENLPYSVTPGDVLEMDADKHLYHYLRRWRQCRVADLEEGWHLTFQEAKITRTEFKAPIEPPGSRPATKPVGSAAAASGIPIVTSADTMTTDGAKAGSAAPAIEEE